MEKSTNTNITITHINIRESISILVLKLITIDFFAATGIILIMFFNSLSFSANSSIIEKIFSYNSLFFLIVGLFKISFTIYVVLLWLNEYYELTPTAIIHNNGLLWREEKRYQLEYVRTIKVYQGIFGKFLNFGTIELYDARRNRSFLMYLIHNPHRYVRILEKLIKNPHEEKHEIRTLFERSSTTTKDSAI